MSKVKWALGFLLVAYVCINVSSFYKGFPFINLHPSWAQERPKQIRGTKDGVIVNCQMYVMGKTGEGVIISEELFRILPSSVILDTDGKEITLTELKVPSMALVEYSMKTDNSSPSIIKLQLLSEPQKTITRRKVGRRYRHVTEYKTK